MTTRWFTDTAISGAAEIQAKLTAVEAASLVAILTFAADEANALHELMHCVDADGTAVIDTSTGYRQAPRTPAMDAAIVAKRGIRLWHNHPSRDSISNTDWLCAGIDSSIEVLAVNDLGSMFVGRIVDWDDRLHELLAWLPRLAGDLEFHMQHLANARKLDPDQMVALGRLTGHVLNRALAACMPVRYAYRFIGPEAVMVDALSATGILSDGEVFAAAAIIAFQSQQQPKPS